MKPTIEFLNELPDEYRDRAIENFKALYGNSWPDPQSDSVYDALTGAFVFSETPQGKDYWWGIADKYLDKSK